MKVYIECYHADGSQILGNLDGQAVITAKNYKRTKAYKHLAKVVGNPKWMNAKVAFAKVVAESGRVLETVYPVREFERAALAKMTDNELVAYWNVLEMSGKTIQNEEAKAKTQRHLPLVAELLTERGIPHEQGKLINRQ